MQKGRYTNKSVMKILTTVLIFISFNLNANEEKLREWAYINTIDGKKLYLLKASLKKIK